jgi:hypothetical protein
MKASRLLSIMMLLQARKHMTAAALAQSLEVSERTILRRSGATVAAPAAFSCVRVGVPSSPA